MYLKEFDLNEDIMEKNISEISGGEKQRIGIIAALLLEREIYISYIIYKEKCWDFFLLQNIWLNYFWIS